MKILFGGSRTGKNTLNQDQCAKTPEGGNGYLHDRINMLEQRIESLERFLHVSYEPFSFDTKHVQLKRVEPPHVG